MAPARRPFVGGNWKMNTLPGDAAALAEAVAAHAPTDHADVAVFPPFTGLHTAKAALGAVALGAQDCHPAASGAFTGEISLAMLADLGVTHVLAGHSERRHVLGESDAFVGEKRAAIQAAGMTCVLCVGETLEEREAGQTDAVNERQLRAALTPDAAPSTLVVAYEPVWAIGTGKTATPEDAQNAHAACRAVLAEILGGGAAGGIRIIYGGSVKPANAESLFAQPDIDGGLIGGASLEAEGFVAICNASIQGAPSA